MNRRRNVGENEGASSSAASESPPPSSVFRDPGTYLVVQRVNEAILRNCARYGSERIWSPYRDLFFGGYPAPIFYDYRQMLHGESMPNSFSAGPPVAYDFRTQLRSHSTMGSYYPPMHRGMETRQTVVNALPIGPNVAQSAVVEESIRDTDVPLSKEILESEKMPSEIGGLRRRWIPVNQENDLGQNGASAAYDDRNTFTVCTYNVLCQSTLRDTGYLYSHCPAKYLSWQYRWKLMQREFAALDADVYCLQEVEKCFYESHYSKYFQNRGYEGLFKCRTGTKPDGCAIFWRRRMFDLSYGYNMDFQVADSILDRDNVALIVSLEQRQSGRKRGSGKKVIIANTHLLFNPGRGDIKLCQAAMLLAKIQQISSNPKNNGGIIICGDFNIVPFSPLYKFLVDGHLHYVGLRRGEISGQQKKGGPALQYPLLPAETRIDESTCTLDPDVVIVDDPGSIGHRLNLLPAYSHWSVNGQPEVSTFNSSEPCNVDYIFYRVKSKPPSSSSSRGSSPNGAPMKVKSSPGEAVKVIHDRLRLDSVLSLPGREEMKRTVGPLPSQFCASDHLPLMAKFTLLD